MTIPKSTYWSHSSFSLAARFKAREWTVRLSGDRARISSRVWDSSSIPSPGRPMMRSMLMLSNPISRARRNFSFTISTVWRRPMRSRVFWFMVWGLMEMRVTPWRFNTSSFSRVMLSGLPASTVNSRTPDRSKRRSTSQITRSRCSAERAVGVPPPK